MFIFMLILDNVNLHLLEVGVPSIPIEAFGRKTQFYFNITSSFSMLATNNSNVK